jgi:hypothetical protein
MQSSLAASLNRDCRCISIDREALAREYARFSAAGGLTRVPGDEATLFASVPVYLAPEQAQGMREIILAVERAAASPVYRARVLGNAKAIAAHEVATKSVFMGYDFHLSDEGPKLIEINTNAGGPLLNLLLAKAQRACCNEAVVKQANLEQVEADFIESFRSEWRLARGTQELRTIAIVDDEPERQFLYPEFILFRELLRRAGYDASVVAADALRFESGALWHGEQKVDLVYNRLAVFLR